MIERYVEAASTYASEIDDLILLVTVLVGFWFVVCEFFFFWMIFRFRAVEGRRTEYVTGEEKELKRWISIPHALVLVCDIFIIIGAVQVWYNVKQVLPPADEIVRVISQQWAWTFVHPGPDRELNTADDITTIDELHIKTNTLYHYKLEARDVLHSFPVPVFRLKQDAVPGRIITGWFEATKTGSFDIQCAEICGIGHGLMGARIFIETAEQHAAWMEGRPLATLAALAGR